MGRTCSLHGETKNSNIVLAINMKEKDNWDLHTLLRG
jgi:hypothetical protein